MESFVAPPLLKAGSRIAITAPARKIDINLLNQSVDILQEWGLQVVVGKNVFAGTHTYMSGFDEQRLEDLQAFINDETISAILCARGGYGSSRIVDQLNMSALEQRPKWLIGFSDITSIHMKCLLHGLQCVHGSMPVLFPRADSAVSIESLRKLLFNGVAALTAQPSIYNRQGEAEAIVVGGNLSLLVDSLGTATEIQTEGRILLIEEIDEYYYKVDRMLNQLKRAGKLSSLRGLVVGHMTSIKNGELTFAKNVEEVVLDAVKDAAFPVAFNLPSGHENPNLAWIQGGQALLNVSHQRVSLRFSPVKSSSELPV